MFKNRIVWMNALMLLAGCGGVPPALHLRSAPQDFAALGIEPGSVKPWEDGRRTVQDGKSFEWWYFDSLMEDGTAVVVTFSDNIMGERDRRVVLEVTTPDGKAHHLRQISSEPGSFAKDHTDVRIGRNVFDGDLDRYNIKIDLNNPEGLGVDLQLERQVPPNRAGTGVMSSGDRYFAWLNAVPHGQVTGTITVDGKTTTVKGNGYHDHNWGNAPMSDLLERWWWGRATVGGHTVVTYDIHAKPSAGGSEVALLYVGSPQRVEKQAFDDKVAVKGGDAVTHPDSRHPRTINSSVGYSADGTSATFSTKGPMILSLDLLQEQSGVTKALAGVLGMKPWYTRFKSPVALIQPGQPNVSGTGILEYLELK